MRPWTIPKPRSKEIFGVLWSFYGAWVGLQGAKQEARDAFKVMIRERAQAEHQEHKVMVSLFGPI